MKNSSGKQQLQAMSAWIGPMWWMWFEERAHRMLLMERQCDILKYLKDNIEVLVDSLNTFLRKLL